MQQSVEVNDKPDDLEFDDIVNVARGASVHVPNSTYKILSDRQFEVVNYIQETDQPAYGFNRGFGSNVYCKVEPRHLAELQENLIRSHACCLGDAAPIEVVRGAMLLRARSLALGYSGVRPEIVQRLVAALNIGIIPVVPSFGSVSASGDLAPLSHIALSLFLGEGEAYVIKPGDGSVTDQPRRMPARDALRQANLRPIPLQMKEGLALNNGVQYSTSLCALAADRLLVILKSALAATAVTAQVMLGADTPFRKDLHERRRHKGSQYVAEAIFQLMKGSPLREAHRRHEIDGEIQDPYNLRCAAQILGPCLELIWRAIETVTIEANSVTDNPLILMASLNSDIEMPEKYQGKYVEIVSGGHFHGMPVAVDAYGLLQAASIISRLSNMRCVRFVDADRNKGLGADLKWPGRLPPKGEMERLGVTIPFDRDEVERLQSIRSAMMIPEYTSAGLTNWIWGQAMPNHLFSLSTNSGQEDHVSMAANVALKAYDVMPRLAEVVGIELAFASQAAAIRKALPAIPSKAPVHDVETGGSIKEWHPIPAEHRRLSAAGERILDLVGSYFSLVEEDRSMASELSALGNAVLQGEVVREVDGMGGIYFENFRIDR